MLGKASLCNSKCRTPKPSSEKWHHQMETKSDGSPHLPPHQQSDKVKTHVFSCSWPHGNVCNLLLNTVPCPFILTFKCMLSTHQTVKTPCWGSWALARVDSHEFNKCSHYQSFSLPSEAQMIQLHWKQKGNESKETLRHLISWIWQMPFLQANQHQTIWTSWNSLGLLSEQRQIFTDETMTEEEKGFCIHVWVEDQPCHDVTQCLMHLPDYLQACSALQSLQR